MFEYFNIKSRYNVLKFKTDVYYFMTFFFKLLHIFKYHNNNIEMRLFNYIFLNKILARFSSKVEKLIP